MPQQLASAHLKLRDSSGSHQEELARHAGGGHDVAGQARENRFLFMLRLQEDKKNRLNKLTSTYLLVSPAPSLLRELIVCLLLVACTLLSSAQMTHTATTTCYLVFHTYVCFYSTPCTATEFMHKVFTNIHASHPQMYMPRHKHTFTSPATTHYKKRETDDHRNVKLVITET